MGARSDRNLFVVIDYGSKTVLICQYSNILVWLWPCLNDLYTEALLSAVPNPDHAGDRVTLDGEILDPVHRLLQWVPLLAQ